MSANPFVTYVQAKVGNIPQAKLEKALKGLTVRLTNSDLNGDRVMLVHPSNARLINKARKQGTGVSINFTSGEALADLDLHDRMGGSFRGGSLWSWLKTKALPWVKSNWGVIKPVLSAVADVAIPAAATALGAPTAGAPVRSAVKQFTGVGAGSRMIKGSEEARAYMASIRAKRKGL